MKLLPNSSFNVSTDPLGRINMMPRQPRAITSDEYTKIATCLDQARAHQHFVFQSSVYQDEWTDASVPIEILTVGFDYSTYTRADNDLSNSSSILNTLVRRNEGIDMTWFEGASHLIPIERKRGAHWVITKASPIRLVKLTRSPQALAKYHLQNDFENRICVPSNGTTRFWQFTMTTDYSLVTMEKRLLVTKLLRSFTVINNQELCQKLYSMSNHEEFSPQVPRLIDALTSPKRTLTRHHHEFCDWPAVNTTGKWHDYDCGVPILKEHIVFLVLKLWAPVV